MKGLTFYVSIWKHGTNTDPNRSKAYQIKVLINHSVSIHFWIVPEAHFRYIINPKNNEQNMSNTGMWNVDRSRSKRLEIYFITLVVIRYYLIEAKKEKEDFRLFPFDWLYRKVYVKRKFQSGLCQSNREKRKTNVLCYTQIPNKHLHLCFMIYKNVQCSYIQ